MRLFANNATSTLASGLAVGATSIALNFGDGAKFPSPSGGDYFLLTLSSGNPESAWEIVKCTARSTDTLTVVRAQEGTSDVEWFTGNRAELRWTKGSAEGMVQTGTAGALSSLAIVGVSDIVQHSVKAFAGQASNLAEWLSSAGAVVASMSVAGLLTVASAALGAASATSLLVGTSPDGGLVNVSSDTTATGLAYLGQASADVDSFDLHFRKSRGTTASPTAISSADELGTIKFAGYSGAGGYVVGAMIKAVSAGTIASTRVAGVLEVWTGTDAAPTVLTKLVTLGISGGGTLGAHATFVGNLDTGVKTSLSVGLPGLALSTESIVAWTGTANYFNTKTTSLCQISAGVVGVGTGASGSFAGALKAASYTVAVTTTGELWERGYSTELLTLSTSGTTTDTTANLLPANCIIEAVVARITTTITVATSWQLGDPTTPGRFTAANATMTAGTTDIGLVHIDVAGAGGPRQTAAAKVRATTVGTPGAGAMRITAFWRKFTAPTS
jgi:hypothetical protein